MKEIIINSVKYGIKKVLVDDEDYEKVYLFKWYLQVSDRIFYAIKEDKSINDGKRRKISLHKYLIKVEKGMEIDHIDNNGLNCQKSNLRVCTHKNNMRNRRRAKNSASKYLGVFIKNCKVNNKVYPYWVASIKESSKTKCTETKSFPFTDEGELNAAKFYDMVAKKHYGEFANLNFK